MTLRVMSTWRLMSKLYLSVCLRYGKGSGSWGKLSTRNGSNAYVVTTHGEIVVPKFLAVNGPKGMYSHFWISLATNANYKINLYFIFFVTAPIVHQNKSKYMFVSIFSSNYISQLGLTSNEKRHFQFEVH